MTERREEPTESELPKRGRLLGIDYGTKRVGVAVSDVFQEIATPLHNYTLSSHVENVRFYTNIAEEYQIAGLVVGLPLHVSGDESEKSQEARRYASWLSRLTGLPFAFQDERYSSVQAESYLLQAELTKKQRKSRMDKLAAQILLQEFLNRCRPAESDADNEDDDSVSD